MTNDAIYNKFVEAQADMAAKARAKLLQVVMREENCDLDRARDLCLGNTDPIDYGYTLAWKIEDPMIQHGMWSRTSSRSIREKFTKHFRESLCPEEDQLFEEYYIKDGIGEKMYQRRFKKAKR